MGGGHFSSEKLSQKEIKRKFEQSFNKIDINMNLI